MSSNECKQFRQLLLLNFFFRLNYYFLRRMDFLNKRLSQHSLFEYSNNVVKYMIKFTGVFVMLLYVLLSLWAEPRSIVTMSAMIVIVLLVCGIAYARVKYDDELVYQKTTQNYFKLLLTIHIILTIFIYGTQIFLFYIINKFDDEKYRALLNNNFLAANLNRNRLYTKEDFISFLVQHSHINFNIEAFKTMILVLSALVVDNSGMFITKDNKLVRPRFIFLECGKYLCKVEIPGSQSTRRVAP